MMFELIVSDIKVFTYGCYLLHSGHSPLPSFLLRIHYRNMPSKSLLDLPREVRMRIYKYCGATRACPINLGGEGRRAKIVHSLPELRRNPVPDCYHPLQRPSHRVVVTDPGEEVECFCDLVPLQLLLCCRTIYLEVAGLLYGENTFDVVWQDGGLQVFEQLSRAALASITSVQLDLGLIPRAPWSGWHGDGISRLFSTMSTRCTLFKLNLVLKFIFGAIEDFKVVRRELERLSGLKSCAVSLMQYQYTGIKHCDSEETLQQRAKQMVNSSTHDRKWLNGGFRFLELPTEVQLEVLRHTDLVGRWRRTWRYDGFVIRHGGSISVITNDDDKCCKSCTPTLFVCCCPHSNPSYSSTCACFVFPKALFHVSKQFSRLARQIFFAENRFIFRGHPATITWVFNHTKAEVLGLLRTVDFHIEVPSRFREPQLVPWLASWSQLVHCAMDRLNVSNLSLSIDAGMSYMRYKSRGISEHTLSHIHRFYFALLGPFRAYHWLRRLRQFFVFLMCFHDLEVRMEKMVKGQNYDSALEGKIPHTRRNPQLPHGAPHPDLEWKDGMSLK